MNFSWNIAEKDVDSTEYRKLVDFVVSAVDDQWNGAGGRTIDFEGPMIYADRRDYDGEYTVEVSLRDINPNDIEPSMEHNGNNIVCLITKFRRRKVIIRTSGKVTTTDNFKIKIKQEIDHKQVRIAFVRIIEHWNTQGCFIATAVYESSTSQEVLTLRKFRDEILSNTFFGKQVIKAYYLVSPSIANFIENKKSLKSLIKYAILDPIVKKVQHHLKKGGGSN